MLEVDCAHNHPVMKAFVQLLWSLHEKNKATGVFKVVDENVYKYKNDRVELVETGGLKRVESGVNSLRKFM